MKLTRKQRDYRRNAKKFKALGLRCDGQPLAPRRPCGCWRGCLKCGGRGFPPEKVAAMWAEFQSGKSMSQVERDHGVGRGGLREIFRKRGYVVPPCPGQPKRDPVTGQVIPLKPATPAQITAAIRKMTRVTVPPELRQEWKKRPMAWRVRLIRRIRAHVPDPNPQPAGPFSRNVIPFEYGTPVAMKLAARMNAGRNSQNKVTSLRPGSQGVIYQGKFWFWIHRIDRTGINHGYISMGPAPRRLLHRVIYEQHHGPIPAQHHVIFRDGNKNNLDPRNLGLRSMADCARMNSIPQRLKKDPHNPELLAKMKLRGERIAATRVQTNATRARAATAALVQSFQSPNRGLLAALKQ